MENSDLRALGLNTVQANLLERFGFDLPTFLRLREELRRGSFHTTRNQLTAAHVEPVGRHDLVAWPAVGSAQQRRYEAAGVEAIRRGEVGVAILNGGMATRFGGAVKGVVEVADGRSFIGYKLADVAAAPGRVVAFLMSSFATDAPTQEHLLANAWFGLGREQVRTIHQGISIRLTPAGEIFRGADLAPSFYAPGHGDLLPALRGSRGFADFRAHGGKLLLVSNVDNLGASLAPLVIGVHILHRKALTVEVAPRAAGDTGGAPARVDGRLEVVEGFRFPPDFDLAGLSMFNTNTFVLNADLIDEPHQLTWFRADKTVDGSPVVQFERLFGELTAFVDATYLEVPRNGPEGRFLPVKVPADLDAVRPLVQQRFAAARAASRVIRTQSNMATR